jgi:tetratricopeptide (TPR) repeat protein
LPAGLHSGAPILPAYLCLADIAARAHAWNEVLRFSDRALELDPAQDILAYEYNAAAHLNLHHLTEAEKSGLRAVDIDKNHREPRALFVIAQIYEAKGDTEREINQLREYVDYADNAQDMAVIQALLLSLKIRTPRISLTKTRPRATLLLKTRPPPPPRENVPGRRQISTI